MGKTHREALASIMKRYERAWKKAVAEWQKFGEVSESTDYALRRLEEEMALLGA